MPMAEHGSVRNVGCPEVVGLRFAAAGLEVSDGRVVEISVKCEPMFVLNFVVNDR